MLNLLVFLIGRIPIATPTVLSVTMAIGSHRLSEQGAITKRMTAIEEMAGMDDKVHSVKFAERGLRSLAVARHKVPEKTKERAGGPWQFVALLPLFDRPRHDDEEIIQRALNLGVNVKMITGDQLAIAKERKHISGNNHEMTAALHLQVSIISQALIFMTQSCGVSLMERLGMLLMGAFLIAQLVATLLAMYHNWEFASIRGVGWGWAGVIWLYSLITYFPLDILKFIIRYVLGGKAWDNFLENKTAFTTKKDYGKEEREAQWAVAQRILHGLQPAETNNLFPEKTQKSSYRELPKLLSRLRGKPRLQGVENFTHSRDMLSPWRS